MCDKRTETATRGAERIWDEEGMDKFALVDGLTESQYAVVREVWSLAFVNGALWQLNRESGCLDDLVKAVNKDLSSIAPMALLGGSKSNATLPTTE